MSSDLLVPDELIQTEVLGPLDQPTDWVSQMSIAKRKSGDIRICIDPRLLNDNIMSSQYLMI